jgi:hypothetical protein
MQAAKCLAPEEHAVHVKVIILSAILVRHRGHSEQASEQGLHTEKEHRPLAKNAVSMFF